MSNPKLETTIRKIDGGLRMFARQFANADCPADDIYQNMVLAICEKVSKSPEFLDQNPGYILRFAKWSAYKTINRSARYRKHVEAEPVVCMGEDDEEIWVETIEDPNPSPEHLALETESLDHLLRRIKELALNETEAKIVRALAAGYNKAEIAARLGIKPQTVSWYSKRIAAKAEYDLLDEPAQAQVKKTYNLGTWTVLA